MTHALLTHSAALDDARWLNTRPHRFDTSYAQNPKCAARSTILLRAEQLTHTRHPPRYPAT